MPPSKKTKTIMIIAGEASGDMHGASLVRAMHKIDPALNFYGIGGNKLEGAGVKILAHASEMAVVGLTEVIAKLGKFISVMNLMKKSLNDVQPDLVILIDYAGFNLRLAKAAHQKGIKVFYYISPQVWASRQGRIKQIKKFVTRMAVILPFEVDTYAQKGFTVNYVGHPLLDMVKTAYSQEEARNKFDLSPDKTTIALLPGSRNAEVTKLLPEMIKAAEIIRQKIPESQFILPLADMLERKKITTISDGYQVPVKVISDSTYDVIASSDLAIVASGTATLETALLGIPMIIIYKTSPLTYFIGKRVVTIKNIGIVNIIAGKTIVPELIQDDANAQQIAAEALAILGNPQRRQKIIEDLAEIRARLGKPGAAIRAAQLAYDML